MRYANVVLVLGILIGGCTHPSRVRSSGRIMKSELARQRLDAGVLDDDKRLTPDAPGADAQPAPHLAVVEPRKVIYTAALGVIVQNLDQAIESTRQTAERLGGYMERTTRNAIVVRVPAERFEEALGEIEKLGPVPEREIVAQDVTEEYTDLKLRLANARKLRDKLTALLDRAENIQDILAIEKELSRVTGEIERLEGRLNKLKHQVAFSKISVAFARYENAPAGWRSQLPFHWLRTLGVENLLNLN